MPERSKPSQPPTRRVGGESGNGRASEYSSFERFAKALVNVPKKEIDEQAKKWKARKKA